MCIIKSVYTHCGANPEYRQEAHSYSISKSKMTRRRAADSINNTAGEADNVSFDLEME